MKQRTGVQASDKILIPYDYCGYPLLVKSIISIKYFKKCQKQRKWG